MDLQIVPNNFGTFDIIDEDNNITVDIDFKTEESAKTWIEWTFFKDDIPIAWMA